MTFQREEWPRLGQASNKELASGIGRPFAGKRSLVAIALMAMAVIMSVSISVVGFVVFQYQSVLFALVATAPVNILCLYTIFRRFYSPEAGLFRTFGATMSLLILTSICSGAAFLALNQALDHKPSTQRAYVVQDKRISRGNRHTDYMAGIDIDDYGAPPPFSEKLFPVRRPNRVEIKVSWRDLRSIAPGRSTIVMTLHPGFLGVPWISRDYSLLP